MKLRAFLLAALAFATSCSAFKNPPGRPSQDSVVVPPSMILEGGTTTESCDGRPGGFLKALQLVAKASAARRKARSFIAVGPPSAGRRVFLALQCRLPW